MSRNAIVSITAINAALSLTIRDFSVALLVTKSKDVKTTDGLPVAITSVADLKTKYGFGDTDKEVVLLEGYFGASTSPEYIYVYGDSTATKYNEILEGLDNRWKAKWFYTIVPVSQESDVTEALKFIKGTTTDYVLTLQGASNFTTANNLQITKNNSSDKLFYIATDKNEGQITNLLATVKNFFPGAVPWSSIKLSNLTGSKYSLNEILELVGTQRESSTGVNIVTEEDQLVIPYYGKAADGITWFDYTVAKIAIDEYMRVGITQYIVEKNTSGEKISTKGDGPSKVASKGTSILRTFAKRGIIYDIDELLSDGTSAAYSVKVVSMTNRNVEIEYKCWFQGAIIKSTVQIILNAENGN